jgi:5-methylcytosine-specific restriction enzyme subunit McrC
MAALFETFVRTAMRESLGCTEQQFPSGDQCPPLRLDTGGRVRLKPDLSYWPSTECTFVGDVKYKRDTTSKGENPDLYQLLAYATATRLPEATLVYALGPQVPRTHVVIGSAVRLHVVHLDLSLPPAALIKQLAMLAQRVATRGLDAVTGDAGSLQGV